MSEPIIADFSCSVSSYLFFLLHGKIFLRLQITLKMLYWLPDYLLLEGIQVHTDPRLLVGFDKSDDASVYKISDELALVQTVALESGGKNADAKGLRQHQHVPGAGLKECVPSAQRIGEIRAVQEGEAARILLR